jgi:hypothetical protein
MKSTASSGDPMNAWEFHRQVRVRRSRAMYAFALAVLNGVRHRLHHNWVALQLKQAG